MIVRDGAVVWSASDLKAAVECEWALMRRLDAKLGRVEAVPDPDDEMNRRAAALGDDHERRQLDVYLAEYGPYSPGRPGGVAVIARPESDFDAYRAAQAASLAAMADGADVVFQATFFDGDFLGFADFLVRDGTRWDVFDTKLARRARVTALLQLAAYATRLRALGLEVGGVHLLLGDGTTSSHRLTDIEPVFVERTARLASLVRSRLADTLPIAWNAVGVTACGRCAECAAQVEALRDPLLVARLTMPQRRRLRAAGITTIDAFAASTGPVVGIGPGTLHRLRRQAALQLEAEQATGTENPPVRFEVIEPDALAALPATDPGDVFFDFEGDPLWSDDHREWGLEYLFGVVVHGSDGGTEFRPFWAHDRAAERQALLDFLAFVAERRRRFPRLHIYHYADYERSHLLALCARHGVGEAALDELLRDHVLVDLYPIVVRSIRVSERSYSLKKLEPLTMGDDLRTSEVTTGAGSIDAYVRYQQLVAGGDVRGAAAQLAEIADYNEYDCRSTLALRDWLLRQADARGVPRRFAPPEEPEHSARVKQLEAREEATRRALLAGIDGVAAADRSPAQTAIALTAAAIDFHRREDTTYWWEHFDRQFAPLDEWADTRDVLIVDSAVGDDWTPGRSRTLRLTGRLAPGSTLGPGAEAFAMYAAPAPGICGDVPVGHRGEHAGVEVVEVRTLPDGSTRVTVTERSGAWAPWTQVPIALTPRAPFYTTPLRQAILDWGERLAHDPHRRDAIADVLRRRPTLAGRADSPADAATIVRTLLDLSATGGALAVQGPPGTGKTHVGAEVIRRLVTDHAWRIGVVAQSHAVVENLLDRVVDAGLDPDRVAKRPQDAAEQRRWTALAAAKAIPEFLGRHEDGCVIGGTAWTFSTRNQVDRGVLDLLVIDEAGQFSLANTIATGVSARNILLLGDPQQLPQVSRGLHPEPVDRSALGWLAGDEDVLPAEFGFFLASSWRMHPALCVAVSDLAYQGRLHSQLPTTTDRLLDGVAPGMHPVPVVHADTSGQSRAEAVVVVQIAASHIGRQWTDPSAGRSREPLRQRDVIVVAPYNAQVALIRSLLDEADLPDVRVGTVDKFQGQEAVVALVSLTASSAAETPRGVEFVLNRNRLNVAISRAQWASYLVHSPALADQLPHSAEGLAQLSGFLRLTSHH